ncbi:MAG: hypothetical protein ACM3NR_03815 [Methanosarcina sp.]
MKKASLFLLILLAGLTGYSQKDTGKPEKDKVIQNNPDTKYTEDASGVKRSISYAFSSDANDADPGNGTFKYNSANISKATFIYLDDNDLSGDDQTKWYKTWDDTTGATGRGQLNIVEKDGKNINVFYVTGVFTDENGYWKIPVEYVSGDIPAKGTTYFYIFNRISRKNIDQTGKPEEVVKPVEQVVEKPVEQIIPVVEQKKEEIVKPVEQVITVVEQKKEEIVKPIEQVVEKPVEQVIPVAEQKKEENVKPVEQVVEKPVEQVIPVAEQKREEIVKPVEQVVEKPVEQVIPVAEQKREEIVKPVEQVVEKPVEQVIPVVEQKKEEIVKPVEQVVEKPVEQVIPVVEQKKEEIVKVAETESSVVKNRDEASAGGTNRRVEIDPVTQRRERPATQTTQTQTQSQTSQTSQTKPSTQAQTQSTQYQTHQTTQNQTVSTTQTVNSTETRQSTQTQTTRVIQPEQKSSGYQNSQNTYTTQTGHVYTPVQKSSNSNQSAGRTTAVQDKQVTPTRQELPSTQSTGTLGSQGYHSVSTYTSDAGSLSVRGKKRWHGIIEAGYGWGVGEYGMDNFRLNFINAISIGKCSSIGLGIGYRRFFDSQSEHMEWYSVSGTSQLPVFLDLRTHFSTRKITPYLALGMGSSARIGSSKIVNEGLYLCPSGGIWFNISDRFAVFAGAAFEVQKLEFANFSDNVPYKKNASSVSVNLGISF